MPSTRIGFRIGEDLDKAAGVAERPGAAVGHEGKRSARYGVPDSLSCCSFLPTHAISGEV
jgi:hypothetical protein